MSAQPSVVMSWKMDETAPPMSSNRTLPRPEFCPSCRHSRPSPHIDMPPLVASEHMSPVLRPSSSAKHRPRKHPLNSCTPRIPKTKKMKRSRITTFESCGMQLSSSTTNAWSSGNRVMARRGRMTRRARSEVRLPAFGIRISIIPTQTMKKSSQFQEFDRYEPWPMMKPRAMTFRKHSTVKTQVKKRPMPSMISRCCETGRIAGTSSGSVMSSCTVLRKMSDSTILSHHGFSRPRMRSFLVGLLRVKRYTDRALYLRGSGHAV
mmetsp:Transcript_39310/g.93034  ORF Transcript_39310/g.93034 Transcript_39310/m.93034 type:complete len:263 (-) Transcript_39310:305-1093(-)